MSTWERIPGNRDGEATQDVGTLLAALTRALPSIEPFGTDNVELSGLPKLPVYPGPDPLAVTQLSVTQCAYNTGVETLSVIKRHEDAVAGLKAREIARIVGAAAVEAELLGLDTWQDGIAASSTATEIALTFGIPERTATVLEHHSVILAGPQGGPIPQDIAWKLLADSSSFLRVLTDPISGEALPLNPTRYNVRDADRFALQAITGGGYVPNCQNPVMDTELDHLRAFEFGGASTLANLRPACKRHHCMRHYEDDKDRHGQRRCINEPERQGIKLRGWTPKATNDGRVGWIAPSGTYQPPLNTDPQRPRYPKWLKKLID